MLLMIEVPDDCERALRELRVWMEGRKYNSAGEVVAVHAGEGTEKKYIGRVLSIRLVRDL